MNSLFSELRKLWDDVVFVLHSPTKINAVFHTPIYSNTINLILANLVNGLLGFVFWIVVARLYTTETVGEASAIISAATLIEAISGLGIAYGLIRFLNSSNNAVKLINTSFTLTGLLSLAIAGIFIIGIDLWAPGLNILRQNIYYLLVFLIFVPVSVLDGLTDQVMIAERQAKYILIHVSIFNIMRLALPILLVVFFQSIGIFSAWSAATLTAMLVSLFFLLPRVRPGYHFFFTVDRRALSEILQFSFLNYMVDLFWTMPSVVLPIIVIDRLGAKSSAYFYMAWTMSAILTMIPGAVATSLLAEGAHDEARLKNHIRRSFKMMVVILIPAVVVVWLLASKLLLFYGGQYAQNASTLLRWLAIATFPLAINILYFGIKRIQKNLKPIILLAASMALITLIASYLLLQRLGIEGVGIAWLGGQSIITFVAVVFDMRRWV